MARDYLTIPGKYTFNKPLKLQLLVLKIFYLIFILYLILATSVPVERAFSGETDLVTQKRCSLLAETIWACMCLKSWWKAEL